MTLDLLYLVYFRSYSRFISFFCFPFSCFFLSFPFFFLCLKAFGKIARWRWRFKGPAKHGLEVFLENIFFSLFLVQICPFLNFS